MQKKPTYGRICPWGNQPVSTDCDLPLSAHQAASRCCMQVWYGASQGPGLTWSSSS